ncbi:MAG: 5'-nucleotidase C-terminal domain-containing protein, partial [Clostridiales bacterium]|nr:5'-nucleotidase C-terminal domain-containing protein [Clostridiales bacterium]
MVNFFDEDDIDAGNDRLMVAPENVVAIWNGGNLRDFLNAGHVTMNDVRRVLPFPNRVAVMYLTGAQLLEMLEAATQGAPFTSDTFAASASFPHVAGIEFTLDTTIPFDAGEAYGNHWFRANSIRRVTIDSVNGNAFDPAATYAIITSNAIFNGMDSNYISLERDEEFSTITSAFVVDVVWMYIMQELGGVIGEEYAAPQGNITVVVATEE